MRIQRCNTHAQRAHPSISLTHRLHTYIHTYTPLGLDLVDEVRRELLNGGLDDLVRRVRGGAPGVERGRAVNTWRINKKPWRHVTQRRVGVGVDGRNEISRMSGRRSAQHEVVEDDDDEEEGGEEESEDGEELPCGFRAASELLQSCFRA